MTALKHFSSCLVNSSFLGVGWGGTLEASPEWMEIILGLVILINLKIVNGTHCLILIGINVMLLSTLYKLVVMMRNVLKT